MFERFTKEARDAVARSQDEARQLRASYIGSEHLLIAVTGGTGLGAQVLAEYGVTASALRAHLTAMTGDDLDEEALAAMGIDLRRVKAATEAKLGPDALAPRRPQAPPGHIPFSKRAKKVLESALREAVRLHSGEISSGHLLLALLGDAESGDRHDPDDLASRLLHEQDLELASLRSHTERLIEDRAA